jgi:hypothetical protein
LIIFPSHPPEGRKIFLPETVPKLQLYGTPVVSDYNTVFGQIQDISQIYGQIQKKLLHDFG